MIRYERGLWLTVAGLFLTVAVMGTPPGSEVNGDIDGNGVVDDHDLMMLERYLSDKSKSLPNLVHFKVCDINEDGELTADDAEALRQHLQGESLVVTATRDDGPDTSLETGGVVYIRASETFFPNSIAEGTVQIQSRAAGYDSGKLPLVHEQFGGAYFFRWYTAACRPATDYVLTVAVKKIDRSQKISRLAIRLWPPVAEEPLLARHCDLSLPFWDLGLELSRYYGHHSAGILREGAFGRGWSHTFHMRLEFSPDNSVAVYSPGDPRPKYFVPARRTDDVIVPGAFVSPLHDERRVYCDPNGTCWVREPGGVTWEFQPRLLVAGFVGNKGQQSKWAEPLEFQVAFHQLPATAAPGLQSILQDAVEIRAAGEQPVIYRADKAVDPATGSVAYVSPSGDRRRLTRDSSGLLRVRLPDGTAWLYRPGYLLTRRIDRQGNAVSCQYDRFDRLTRVIDGAGQHIVFHYGQDSDLLSGVSDSTGRAVAYKYDQRNNLLEAETAAGVIHYEYDEADRLLSVAIPGQSPVRLAYDQGRRLAVASSAEAGRLTIDYGEHDLTERIRTISRTVSEGQSRTRRDVLNAAGLPSRAMIVGGRDVHCEYQNGETLFRYRSEPGQVWSVRDDREEQFLTDPFSNRTTLLFSRFGAFNRDWTSGYSVTGASGSRTRIEFTPEGRHTQTIHADQSHEINWWRDTDGGIRTVDRRLRDRRTNHYVFDPRGLLLSKSFMNDPGCNYSYDAQGNLTRAVSGSTDITWQFDDSDLPLRVVYPGNRVFQYEYDEAGRRTKMVDPDGLEIYYEYDAAGRLIKVSSPTKGSLATYAYNLASEVIGRRLRNGVAAKYELDEAGRVTNLVCDGLANHGPLEWRYEHDDAGQLTAVMQGDRRQQFEYDACGRLTRAVDSAGGDKRLEYDASGNRRQVVFDGSVTQYVANALDQYTVVGGTKLEYLLCGNLNSTAIGGMSTFEYDGEGRLRRVLGDGGIEVIYAYDALGRVASRKSQGDQVYFLWDLDRIVLLEDARHVTLARYIWGQRPSELLEVHSRGQEYFCLQDPRDNVVACSDSSAALIGLQRYQAFGLPIEPADKNVPFLFHGALYDWQTGLYYLNQRWYSPRLGRYIHTGPAGHDGIAHRYNYAGSNPNRSTDSRWETKGTLEPRAVLSPSERAWQLLLPRRVAASGRPALTESATISGAADWRRFVRAQLDVGIR